tara:strand:- start:110 stop:640 length:531 start_codon:yes stop_codon:yes gene_type:complete
MQKKYSPQNKIVLVILLLLIFKIDASAQEQKSPFWSHVRVGGGIGLSFGSGFFSGTLAPSAVYDFNEKFAMGLGLTGTYNTSKDFYKSSIIGGSILGLYNVIPQLQLSAEFEEVYVNRKYDSSVALEDESYGNPALFLGAGFRQNNLTFGMRYDVLYDEYKSVYASPFVPFVRIYF